MAAKIITLFSEPAQSRSNSTPSTFVLSMIFHGVLLSLVTTRLIENHRIIERFPHNRFAVRHLDFHSTEPEARQAAGGGIAYHGPLMGTHQAVSKPAPGQGSAAQPTMTRQSAQAMPAPQTLLQPDLPPDLAVFKKIPVPLTVIWSPEKTQPVKKVVPPLPEKPSIAVVRPTLETPIKEEALADLHLPSTNLMAQKFPVPASTTSPIVVHGPEQAKKAPETTSKPDNQTPTPARIVSLSDIRVAQGRVTIPKVNESASKESPGTMVPGQLKDLTTPGTGNSASKSSDAKPGQGAGNHPGSGEEASLASSGNGAGKAGSGGQDGKAGLTSAQAAIASGATNVTATGQAGSGSGNGQLSAVHISLPRDGQFGVVVTGSSIEESYPETAELWSGRMAATVYLHVGMAKSWILQYALPRLVDAATIGGHLEAPWPYEILRPNLDTSEMESDAVILHGFVNKEGHFEKLAVVFPERFAQAPMVLNTLNQWQFRPAKQDGKVAPVEVLLIVPEQSD